MGRLKILLNLLVLAVAAAIAWHEYHQPPARRAPAAGASPAGDPLAGAIAAIKQSAAQVATAAAELARPDVAETPAGAAGGGTASARADAEASAAAEADAPSLPEGAVRGDGSADCPETFPIKGNASSMIYHPPGAGSYERTVPELCFATIAAAEAAGFRAPRNRLEREREEIG